MRKKKILLVNEFSGLNTGYSCIGRNLMTVLYKTDKYELTELAGYLQDSESTHQQMKQQFPWRIIGNLPNNAAEREIYENNPTAEFGSWKFEQVCLETTPDIVIDFRDFWMDSFFDSSPFRRFYKTVLLPTVDGTPQHIEWIDFYKRQDYILTYTEFGQKVLQNEGGGLINLCGIASPGINTDIFKPVLDKRGHKASLGLDPDSIIIGMVARNQRRKLYPELAIAFAQFLKEVNLTRTNNVYLYWHTSYPDVGWDLPKFIKDNGLSHKIILTYYCHNCKYWKPGFYQDSRTVCPNCHQGSMILSNSQIGINDEALSKVYNLLDLYVQFVTCFAKDTQILTKYGYKAIQDISLGEEVLTHQGRYKKVLNKFTNLSNHPIKEISVYSLPDKVTVTDNHKFFAYTRNEIKGNVNRSVRENIGTYLRNKREIPNFNQYSVKELQKGDILVYPIDDTVVDIDKFDISKFKWNKKSIASDIEFCLEENAIQPRFIDIDEEMCRFIGLFAADGTSSRKGCISICCNIEEEKNIILAEKCMKRISYNSVCQTPYKKRKAVDVILSSLTHNYIFYEWFKSKNNKQLPEFVMYLPLNKQKEIIIGMFMGDGCYYDGNKKRPNRSLSTYCTTSVKLYEQLIYLLRRLRVNFSITYIKPKGRKQGKYSFEIHGDIKNDNWIIEDNCKSNFYKDNYHCIQIKDIIDSNYLENVYNIEVEEDHSYTTKIGSAKNCEGLGIPHIEAAACGVPHCGTYYSGTTDIIDNLEGFPIQPRTFFIEAETGRNMALPNINELVQYIKEFIQIPMTIRANMGFKAAELARKFYGSWSVVADKWMTVFDSIPLSDNNSWLSPIDIVPTEQIQTPGPNQMSDEQFVAWALTDILHRPDWVNSYIGLRFIRDLNWGRTITTSRGSFASEMSQLGEKPAYGLFDRGQMMEFIIGMRQRYNAAEMARYQYIQQGKIQ